MTDREPHGGRRSGAGRQDGLPTPTPLIERVVAPEEGFGQSYAASGIVLLAGAALALAWANSPWSESYFGIWEHKIAVGSEALYVERTVRHWINEGLMAVFFLLVGLEIKREVLVGDLATPRTAALPVAAALGGMLIPAGLYALLNFGGDAASGWGVPMATDIAFALGVLALVGSNLPAGVKVFLTALAIVDDIGAVLVIAIFYSSDILWLNLGAAGGILVLLIICNLSQVRRPAVYAVLGFALWAAFLETGVHATIAGVLLALTIPARTRINPDEFLGLGRAILDQFERAGASSHGAQVLSSREHQDTIHALEQTCELAQAPVLTFETRLRDVVSFGIMPLFAVANAGVDFSKLGLDTLTSSLTLGIILGLLVGKPLGITLFSWLSVRADLAKLPGNTGWKVIHGVGWLGGIGFTMSLFIAGLAFSEGEQLDAAKLGIVIASLLAGFIGWGLLRFAGSRDGGSE